MFFNFLLFLLIGTICTEAGELVDSRVHIERLWELNTKTSDLHITFTLEQGLVGYDITSKSPVVYNKTKVIPPFHEAYFDFKAYTQQGPTEASLNNEIIIGIRRRFEATISCLHNDQFPFDRQTCTWRLIILGKSKDQLDLRWATKPLESHDLALPQFIVEKISPITCVHESTLPSAFTSTSTHVLHGCLSVVMEFRRSMTIPLTRLFIPTSLALFLSWLSLYTKRSDLLARIILPISSIIIQMLLALNYLSAVTISTTLTPADVWCILLTAQCVLVIFLLFLISIVENKSKKYLDLAEDDKTVRKQSKGRHHRLAMKQIPYKRNQEEEKCLSFEEVMSCEFRKKSDSYSLAAVRIQIVARFLCPLVYISSTVLFFLLYLVKFF
ncbi:unnamed protein product [Auanema sp. JU1783]|nr:unnamed protein product [Auanema sp. JU1783]